MPINASPEYFKAEERYQNAKGREEKILALEEMIRTAPKHKGAHNLLAQLKGKLAKMKKESSSKAAKKPSITKEGDAQVCIIGPTNSGKSWLLSKLTSARPLISEHPYTTTKPEVGMMDYNGIKIQLVEIPATLDSEYLSIARSADAIFFLGNAEEMKNLADEHYVRTKYIVGDARRENPEGIKQRIWDMLYLIIVYTKTGNKQSPMALTKGSTIKSFAARIHKDFIKHFRFARLWRKGMHKQVGLNYVLEDGDIVELHMK